MAQTGKVEIQVTGKDQASPILKGISGRLQAMSKQCRMAGMAMTAMGTVIVGGMTKMTLSYAKAGDQVAKLAKKTGFTTETLSKLRYAAEISGASIDTLAKGVKRMAKTIVDASEGMATYIRSFDRIGLSAEALMKLNPEEQFRTIALAIAGLDDATLRAATAQDIFGRAGTELLPLLAEGADGIEALMQKAEELGIVFDAEAAAAAEKFNDSITTLKTSFMGFGAVLAENLTTVLPDLIEKMTNIVKGIKDWTEKHPGLTKAIVFSTLALGLLMLALGPLLIALPGLPMLIHGVTVSVGFLTGAVTALAGALGVTVGILALATAGLALLGFGIWKVIEARKEHAKWVESNISLQNAYIKALSGEREEYARLLEIRLKDIESRVAMGKATEAEIEWLDKYSEATQRYIDQTLKRIDADKKVAGGAYSLEQATAALASANAGLTSSNMEVATSAGVIVEKMSEADKAVERFLETCKEYTKVLALSGFEIANIEQALRMFSPELGAEWAARRAGEIKFGKPFPAEAPAWATSGVSMGAYEGLEGFAKGGIITKPTPAILGEGGEPEAVFPLSKLAGLLGGIRIPQMEAPIFDLPKLEIPKIEFPEIDLSLPKREPVFASIPEVREETPKEEPTPIENVITNYIMLDGELVGQSVNRSLGNAYMKRERMGG